ncbi:alpha/beta fold hydrolase [Endozoicomonas sp. SCSIO W0465]|uniref:alpha/beta fold hydrolase n=1 Tax=Endozoicomonas sp. SCSIO W0465 TaxID=2918516 RepID=UPI0020759C37|nr:alpha/beta fold hydrolase [Endozoicomonas sp. SCSIO W0465]USE35116.1 alpha/beta fold hydrolase [Endozoicomonas sp. SCSIO W0465]
MKLYARQQGQGADVISLHGLFGSQENLGMINRGLAESFRVHGLDLRNHGRSSHDEAMNYTAMADDVLEYMDDNQLEKVHLVGHSMGGKVAMTVALMAPERVTRLAVIDIAPVTYQERRHDSILEGLSLMPLNTLKSRSEADGFLETYEPEQGVRQFLLKNLYRDDQGNYRWRMNLPAIITHYMEILVGQQSDIGFAKDALFIKGGESDYILPEHRERVLELFPSASVRVIPGAGHWVHAQKPELVTRTLLRFLG